MIDIHAPFKAAPRISSAKFVQVLESVGSFDADALWGTVSRDQRKEEAQHIYDLIVAEGHDPAVWLAIAGKEHTFATNRSSVLWRNTTRSWTNARSVRHPALKDRATVITDPVRKSQYVKYQSATHSVLDGLYRVDEPGYAYRAANATSIVEHIQIWAPGEDGNRPIAYAGTMVDWINTWMAADAGTIPSPPKEGLPMPALPIRVDFIPAGSPNRPSLPMTPRWITIHETSNTNTGANAEMHRRFVNNGGGTGNVSWQYTVDDHEIVQHLPLNEAGWHAGDGYNGTGNRQSIGIELCVNRDGDFTRTRALAARLVAWLMEEHNIPIERVVQHNHWSGKNCPLVIRRDNLWPSFLDAVMTAQDGPRAPQDRDPDALYLNDVPVVRGFRALFESVGKAKYPDDPIKGGLSVFGYPLAAERATPFGSEQPFERVVLRWHRDTSPPFDVVVAHRHEQEAA